MKFLSIALFAGAVLGQASVISDALDNISQKTTALNSAVSAFSGANDVPALQSAATAVISAINQGNTQVEAIGMLDALGASSLIPNIQSLATQVDGAISNLISKKTALTPYATVVVDNLNQIKTATNTFATTTYSKIPTDLVSTAQGLVAPIIASLNRGIAAFQGITPSGTTSSTPVTTSSSAVTVSSSVVITSSGTASAPVYSTAGSSTLVTSVPVGTGSVVPSSTAPISPSITSVTPAPYNPNGASQLTGGFAAVVVAAAVAVAAF